MTSFFSPIRRNLEPAGSQSAGLPSESETETVHRPSCPSLLNSQNSALPSRSNTREFVASCPAFKAPVHCGELAASDSKRDSP